MPAIHAGRSRVVPGDGRVLHVRRASRSSATPRAISSHDTPSETCSSVAAPAPSAIA
jgi:hypothetical protein